MGIPVIGNSKLDELTGTMPYLYRKPAYNAC